MPIRTLAACLTLVLGAVPRAALAEGDIGRSHAPNDLDRMTTPELEAELAEIEHELALYYRGELALAMDEDELERAGHALRAFEGHLSMALRLVSGSADKARTARVQRHARAMALERRVPPGVDVEVRALDVELGRVGDALHARASG